MPDEDVLAALRVATRLVTRSDVLDLRGADLRNCDLTGLPKSQILLEGADVRDAHIDDEMITEMLAGLTRRLQSAVAARARIDQARGAEPRSAVPFLDAWLAPFRTR